MSRCRNGFTVVETLAALLVIGVVTAAALGAAAEELRTARRAAATLEASALAEDLLFRAEFLRWDSLTAYGTATEGRFAAPLDRYGWKLEIAPSPTDSALVDATAIVSWSFGEYAASTRYVAPPAAADSGGAR